MDKIDVFSIPVNIGSYKEFLCTILEHARLKQHCYTCLANVHMLVEAYRNIDFAKTIKNAHVITPDGMPLTWAIRTFYGIKQERVAGMDLLPDLLAQGEQKQLSVYFYGGDPGTLEKARCYIENKYPALQLSGLYSPPFRKLTSQENDEAVSRINHSGAQLVFVSLGCPKQEKWMGEMVNRVNAVMVGIGGALSVMIGAQKRAPKWIQGVGMEWLFRLWQEPGRLFKRYAITNSIFIYLFLKHFLYKRVYYPIKSVLGFNLKKGG